MWRQIRAWSVGIALVTVTALAHSRIPPQPRALDGGEAWVPRPQVAQLLSMGFEVLVGDFHWLRAVQIAGASQVSPTRHASLFGRLIEVVTTLDPWVDHPYRFAAIWMTDSPENVRKANALLARGIEHHPDEWRMRFYKGFNHFFYLGENEAAAAELEPAATLPGAPRYLPRLVARLRSQVTDLGAASLFLRELLRETGDEAARAEYLSALEEIEMEQAARFLDEARGRFWEVHGRDIERVEDLVTADPPILHALPSAEPASLPKALRRGSRWEIDDESGRIQSSYYGRRYELSLHPLDRARRDRWAGKRDDDESGQEGRESHAE